MKFLVLFLNGTKFGSSCYLKKGAALPPLVILRKNKVEQKINSKAFIFFSHHPNPQSFIEIELRYFNLTINLNDYFTVFPFYISNNYQKVLNINIF